jgi:hypothetical protein
MIDEGFKTVSLMGTDLSEFRPDGEKPPRSAKLVISISWSWSPAHSASVTYLLSTTRERDVWLLWGQGYDWDTGKPIYARVAWGAPYRGYSAKFAARQLLAAAWRGEIEQGGCAEEFENPDIDREGLVTKGDVQLIVKSLSDVPQEGDP